MGNNNSIISLNDDIIEKFSENIDTIFKKIEKTPVPQTTLLNFEKIVLNSVEYKITDKEIDYIINIAAYSPFLSGIVRKNPDYFLKFLFEKDNYRKIMKFDEYLLQLRGFTSKIKDIEKFKKYLRYFKQREFLRIGLQDVAKLYSVETVTMELSALAAAFLQHSADWLTNNVYKKIKTENFFILGMGKLAGDELNFSSDIDLIYIYDRGNNAEKFIFVNFFETLTKLINEITEDGFVFRVDLRLRPEGINGPIALDEDSALFYYENLGRLWERGVLLKAKPVAGNIKKGERFLQYLEPFIYRRNLDFQIIQEINNMKNKINKSIEQKENLRNIKLGYGGIREIEFIIQTIQLIFGGKYPAIRIKNSLTFLNNIANYNFLDRKDILFLTEAYKFLRSLEHKIQILYEKQTHTLPKSDDELKIVAGYFNFNNIDDFLRHQENIRKKVNSIFEDFFQLKLALKKKVHEIVVLIELEEKEKIINILDKFKIANIENIYQSLIDLKYKLSENVKDVVKELLSIIFFEIESYQNRGNIIIQFVNLISRIQYSKGYLTFLVKNEIVIKSIMNIFSVSNYLTNLIITYKELFEEIFFTDLLSKLKTKKDLKEEINIYAQRALSFEDMMEQIRVFKHKESLRIGLHFLNKEINITETVSQLTILADVIVEKAISIVMGEFEKKYGKIDNNFTIIALGKYGGKELNFVSDLDIILLFEKNNKSENGLTSGEYFSRFLQRLISFLSIRTQNGIIYEIDTRLRPSGNAGALVTSFGSFKEYHKKSSAIWEVQALLKSRAVAGEGAFGSIVLKYINEIITEKELRHEDLLEILRIRERIEFEEGKETDFMIDIKSGAGGIIDIEFLTQILLLQNKILENNTFKGLELLMSENILDNKTG